MEDMVVLALIWMIEPDIEAYQREQGESSRKQGNNSELIEMLKIM